MTPKDTLLELAERCEAAAAGSQALSLDIWRTVEGERFRHDFSMVKGVMARGSSDEEVLRRMRGRGPDYSRSLDAAMTLVPEGWDWKLLSRYRDNYEASLSRPHKVSHWQVISRHSNICATAALSLAAASLRARSTDALSAGRKPPITTCGQSPIIDTPEGGIR